MSATLIVAIVGAVTGLLSLVIQLLIYLLKKPKISCTLDLEDDSYWIEGSRLTLKENRDRNLREIIDRENIIVLSLEISNLNSIPITVTDIFKDNMPISIRFNFEQPIIKLKSNLIKMEFTLINPDQLPLPLRLNGYDSVRTSIWFLTSKDESDIQDASITLKTPFKDFSFSFKVKSAEETLKNKPFGYLGASLERVRPLEQHKNNKHDERTN